MLLLGSCLSLWSGTFQRQQPTHLSLQAHSCHSAPKLPFYLLVSYLFVISQRLPLRFAIRFI